MSETLTFENGKFKLLEVGSPKLREKLHKNAYWKSLPDDVFETDNLREATAFRKYATEKVEKLLKRTFQEHYDIPKLPSLPLDLHQIEGIKWILSRKRSYLAHCPGAGKTVQAILSAHFALQYGQSVFIVPPSLVLNWQKEILKFTGWLKLWPSLGVVQGSNRQDRVDWNADFLIVPDSMLTKDWVYTRLLTIKKKFICVDEASRFKEPLSERSLAFYGGRSGDKIYRGLFHNSRHVVFLDGSPMPNRPMEIWAPTYALHPTAIDCMGYDDFGYRYCGAYPNDRGQWVYRASSNEEELREKLTKDFMHVVSESELEHPERRRSILFMNEDVRSLHQKSWERLHLKGATLKEVVCKGELASFRKELGLRKVPWIAEYTASRMKEKNESILLFVWHREVATKLVSILYSKPGSVGLIIGNTPSSIREDWFKRFQEGTTKLLVMNIQAAGRGINLQRADRVIFGEFSWSDEVNKQAEKRASRRGSEKEFIRSEYICCPNSMDEIVLNSVFTKEKRLKKVLGD